MTTWLSYSEITPGTANAWTDADVSGSVPSGATGVILHIVNNSGYTRYFGARKNGSTDNRYRFLKSNTHLGFFIGVDANRILELYVGNTTDIDVYLVGYFTDADATFFTNSVDKSFATVDAWTDVDISGDTSSTSIAAFFDVVPSSSRYFGGRKNGSTDDLYGYFYTSNYAYFIGVYGVDGSEICEIKQSIASTGLYLVGYALDGSDMTFATDLTDYSITDTSWADMTALPANATGGFFLVPSTAALGFGLRANGASENIYFLNSYRMGSFFVECDGSQTVEGKVASGNIDFYLIGYTAAAGGGGNAPTGALHGPFVGSLGGPI